MYQTLCIVPDDVIGPPVKVMPVVPPDVLTLVTVPFSGAEMVMLPAPFVMLIPVPAVKVERLYPVPFPDRDLTSL
jgi:hypothetical protein